MSGEQLADWFTFKAALLQPRYPLLCATNPVAPTISPEPAKWFVAEGLNVYPIRIPQGQLKLRPVATRYMNEQWWYAFDLPPVGRKWYSESELRAVNPEPGDIVRYHNSLIVWVGWDLAYDLRKQAYDMHAMGAAIKWAGWVVCKDAHEPGAEERRLMAEIRRLDVADGDAPGERLRTHEVSSARGETVFRVERRPVA